MKLNKQIISVAAVVLLLCSCVSAKAADSSKKSKPATAANEAELIDWQGKTMGRAIPEWVYQVADGNDKKVAKELDIDLNEKMIFVITGRGNDLDFVKTWADNVDARREITTSISQVVATTTQAAMEGMEGLGDAQKQKMYEDTTNMASAIELSGLLKEASYWTKTRTLHVGVKAKKAKDTDYDIEYTYFVVFTMDKAQYQAQLDAAMKQVDDFTSEEAYLKRVLAEKLSQSILPGNNLGAAFHRE